MQDRQDYECAARAAGYKLTWDGDVPMVNNEVWAPKTLREQAFDLQVACSMETSVVLRTQAWARRGYISATHNDPDGARALRKAIWDVAVAMGRT